jgi:polyphosphate kinase
MRFTEAYLTLKNSSRLFSNNLDEFFKVRYASVKRMVDAEDSGDTWINSEGLL